MTACKWRNRGPDKERGLPKVTQQPCGVASTSNSKASAPGTNDGFPGPPPYRSTTSLLKEHLPKRARCEPHAHLCANCRRGPSSGGSGSAPTQFGTCSTGRQPRWPPRGPLISVQPAQPPVAAQPRTSPAPPAWNTHCQRRTLAKWSAGLHLLSVGPRQEKEPDAAGS